MIAARTVLLAAMLAPLARAAAPAYSAASIVNSATNVAGDLAPNGMVSIYGTDLSYDTQGIGAGQHGLPTELADVRVYLNGNKVNLFYVSPAQINFLMPADLLPGSKTLWVFRQGLVGPVVTVTVKATAPGFFPLPDDAIISTHADGSLITADSPALAEEVVVLYAAGLGRTNPEAETGIASTRAAPILLLSQLAILLGGSAVDSSRILYAGITPGFAGLYQINLRVPVTSVENPEIRVFIGQQGSPPFLKLPMRLQ